MLLIQQLHSSLWIIFLNFKLIYTLVFVSKFFCPKEDLVVRELESKVNFKHREYKIHMGVSKKYKYYIIFK